MVSNDGIFRDVPRACARNGDEAVTGWSQPAIDMTTALGSPTALRDRPPGYLALLVLVADRQPATWPRGPPGAISRLDRRMTAMIPQLLGAVGARQGSRLSRLSKSNRRPIHYEARPGRPRESAPIRRRRSASSGPTQRSVGVHPERAFGLLIGLPPTPGAIRAYPVSSRRRASSISLATKYTASLQCPILTSSSERRPVDINGCGMRRQREPRRALLGQRPRAWLSVLAQ
jgi:hypothetical protein